MVLLACGQVNTALTRFDRMLTLKPLDAYALASRAHLQAELKNFDRAIADLLQLSCAWP